jgi:WXG100 family type VII secretion target
MIYITLNAIQEANMAQILVDPDQVDGTSTQFSTKRGELETLINNARTMMTNLQASFKGQRSNAIMGEWNGMQTGLNNAVAALQQASDLLKRAAADFRAADSGR